MNFTPTLASDSPRPVKRRRYDEFADQALEIVRRAINQTQTFDAAHDELQYYVTVTQGDKPAPTKWMCFIDAVAATVNAAAASESDDQRRKLGAAALEYLNSLAGEIKAEEQQLEASRGYFVTSAELAGANGVTYLTNVFGEACANGRHINFEIDQEGQ